VAGNGWYDHEFGSADGTDKSIPNPNARSEPQLPMSVTVNNGTASASSSSSSSSSSSASSEPLAHSKDQKVQILAKPTAFSAKDSKEDKPKPTGKREKQYAWNWMSLQLDDGTDVTATTLVRFPRSLSLSLVQLVLTCKTCGCGSSVNRLIRT
jgi:hypothetical protein